MAKMPPHPAVEVRQTATKGRALVSTRSFTPGATILSTSPLLLLPSVSHINSLCTFCLRAGSPRACTRCVSARYCGAECQRAHWRIAHGKECKRLAEVRASGRKGDMPTPVRLLMQVLLGVGADETGWMDSLEGHVQKWREEPQWSNIEMMAMAACAYAGLGTDEAQVKRACEIMCKIQTNAFNWADVDLGQVGVFLEPTLDMMNHSCIPNAMVHVVGRKVVLRAESAINVGDEIEISYTDYTWSKTKRSHALESYNFQCRCPRCKDDLNVYQVCAMSSNHLGFEGLSLALDVTQHPVVANKQMSALASEMSEQATITNRPWAVPEGQTPSEDSLRGCYRGCKALIGKGLWAVSPVPQLVVDTASFYVDRGQWTFALTIACLISTHCDPYRYTAPFHPVRVKGLFLMAKLLSNTAAEPNGHGRTGLEERINATLRDIDQVSLCQMLLIMVLRLVPAGLAAEWELSRDAQDMLSDIAQLPGRDGETSLIKNWSENPKDSKSQAFFKYAVVDPANALTELGKDVLKAGFDTS